MKGLPFSGRTRSIERGRRAAPKVLALIESPAVAYHERARVTEAIEDLYFVQAMKIDTGVRTAGCHELEIELEATEFIVSNEIRSFAGVSVDQAVARIVGRDEILRIPDALPSHSAAGKPLMSRSIHAAPAAEVAAI
jgi:hypothetical protein